MSLNSDYASSSQWLNDASSKWNFDGLKQNYPTKGKTMTSEERETAISQIIAVTPTENQIEVLKLLDGLQDRAIEIIINEVGVSK
ncbi:MAG: hypothetical protein VXZ59_05945 [Cyanobacteriota bacterium]|nr:hypothetical protein [Cyanobacteriota bacterium]